MRREVWRTERRESRHTIRLELMEGEVAIADKAPVPEEVLVRRCDSRALLLVLSALSPIQLRRLLMHAVAQLPVREIARREGCSERAVKYSLAKARKRVRELLSASE